MKSKIFALVDCNNFYASCERVFNGKLTHRPVAVLSNNDGCIIARSNEVKELGIPMGAPIYQWQEVIEKNNVVVFSANFPLYGDMSHRVMATLAEFVPDIEVYSIDEAFLDLTNLHVENVTEFCKELKATVEKWTGIPVSIGIGSSKTLAKAANKLAKKKFRDVGVFNFLDHTDPDKYLEMLEVEDLWGIGRKHAKFLFRHNINNARDLKYADQGFIRKWLSVMGQRVVLELNGTCCYELEKLPKPKKNIAFTRSFGHYQETYEQLEEAVSYFTRKIGEKLRKEEELASFLQIFLLTNLHNDKLPQYHNSVIVRLFKPSNNSITLIKAAIKGLKAIFKEGYKYKKAGVISLGLIPESHKQYDLFIDPEFEKALQQTNLMDTLDRINRKVDADAVKFAIEGVRREWWMNQTRKSPRYTTSWKEIPLIDTAR
jgi:DNA polymerase V